MLPYENEFIGLTLYLPDSMQSIHYKQRTVSEDKHLHFVPRNEKNRMWISRVWRMQPTQIWERERERERERGVLPKETCTSKVPIWNNKWKGTTNMAFLYVLILIALYFSSIYLYTCSIDILRYKLYRPFLSTGIRARECPQYWWPAWGDWPGGTSDETGIPEVPCRSRYGTIKTSPCSKTVYVEQRPKFCSLTPAVVTS